MRGVIVGEIDVMFGTFVVLKLMFSVSRHVGPKNMFTVHVGLDTDKSRLMFSKMFSVLLRIRPAFSYYSSSLFEHQPILRLLLLDK